MVIYGNLYKIEKFLILEIKISGMRHNYYSWEKKFKI